MKKRKMLTKYWAKLIFACLTFFSFSHSQPEITELSLGGEPHNMNTEFIGEFYGYLFVVGNGSAGQEIYYVAKDGSNSGVFDINSQADGYASGVGIHQVGADSLIAFYGYDGSEYGFYTIDKDLNLNKVTTVAYYYHDTILSYNGEIYFVADMNTGIGSQLYKTSGIAGSYTLVADLWTIDSGYADYLLFADETGVYFSAYMETTGHELYVSQGTQASTTLFHEFSDSTESTNLLLLAKYEQTLLVNFERNCFGDCGQNIGFFNLDTKSLDSTGIDNLYNYGVSEDGFLFSYYGVNGEELYYSDGTVANTYEVLDINAGASSSSYPKNFYTASNGKTYFQADGGPTRGVELYYYQSGGVEMLPDINLGAFGSLSSNPGGFIEYKGEVYFGATDSLGFNRLFRIDSENNVFRVSNNIQALNYFNTNFYLKQMINVGGELYALPWLNNDGAYISKLNYKPEFPKLDTTAVDENVDPNFYDKYFATKLISSDKDLDPIVFSFSTGSGDTHNDYFVIQNDSLFFNYPPDYEGQTTYSIRIAASDGNFTIDTTYVITVNDLNDPPNSAYLDSTYFSENKTIGSLIGSFYASDPELGSVSYSLEPGEGDADNGKFTITGNQLFLADSVDYETQSTLSIRVRASDSLGIFSESIIDLYLSNANENPYFVQGLSDTIPEGFNFLEIINVEDPDHDDLIITATGLPSFLNLIESSDTVKTIAGNIIPGSSNGSYGPEASLNAPTVLYENNDVIYFYDSGNFQIREIYQDTVFLYAGSGSQGSALHGEDRSTASLGEVSGMVVDESGILYFTERDNNIIRKIDTDDKIYDVVGTTVAGYSGDGGNGLSATINGPEGITFNNSYNQFVWVESGNHVIRTYDPYQNIVSTMAGTGSPGSDSLSLNSPTDICFNEYDYNYYVVDQGNQRIVKVVGNSFVVIAGTGVAGFSGDGGQATIAQLNNPTQIACDKNSLFITDTGNNRIRIIDLDNGVIKTAAGTGASVPNGDGLGYSTNVVEPVGITQIKDQGIVFSEKGSNRIRMFKDHQWMITGFPTIADTGLYSITLTATDDSGATVSSVENLFVAFSNTKPDLGIDRQIYLVETDSFPVAIDSIFASDEDSLDVISYSLISQTDSGLFVLDSLNRLILNDTLDREKFASHTILIVASDLLLEDTLSITITVKDINDVAPDVLDTSLIIPDTLSVGEILLNIDVVDPDSLGIHTFKLLSLDTLFAVSALGEISLTSSLQPYGSDTLELILETSDGLFFDTSKVSISVEVINANKPKVSTDTLFISESYLPQSPITTLSVVDLDNPITEISLKIIKGDSLGKFEIDPLTLELKSTFGTFLDFEDQSYYELYIEAFDGLWYDTNVVVINVLDELEPLTGLEVDKVEVSNQLSIGSVIATLNVIDQDTSEIHTFGLAAGVGDTHNAFVELVNNQILLKEPLYVFPEDSLRIRIFATGEDLMSYDTAFVFAVKVDSTYSDSLSFSLLSGFVAGSEDSAKTVKGFFVPAPNFRPLMPGEILEVEISATDPSVFATGPIIDSTGALIYKPIPDVYGSFEVKVRYVLYESGIEVLSANDETFFIELAAQNDMPSAMLKADTLFASSDSGIVIVDSMLYDLNAGPNENDDLEFILELSDSTLFVDLPTIDFDGTLKFTPKPNSTGKVLVQLTVKDIPSDTLASSFVNYFFFIKIELSEPSFAKSPVVSTLETTLQAVILDSLWEYRFVGDSTFISGQNNVVLLNPAKPIEVRTKATRLLKASPVVTVKADANKPYWQPTIKTIGGALMLRLSPVGFEQTLNLLKVNAQFTNANGAVQNYSGNELQLVNTSMVTGVNKLNIKLLRNNGVLLKDYTDSIRVVLEETVELLAPDSSESNWVMGGVGQWDSTFSMLPNDLYSYMYTWSESGKDDELLSRYQKVSGETKHQPGRGYWIFQDKDLSFVMPKQRAAKEVSVKLTNTGNGWHQISNPFSFPIAIDDISPTGLEFYKWDRIALAYVKEEESLEPYQGYWVFVSENTELLLKPVPYFADESLTASLRASGGSSLWSDKIQLVLSASDKRDDNNFMGLASEESTQVEIPQAMAGQINISFLKGAKVLMKDIKAENDALIWNLLAQSSISGIAQGQLEFKGYESLEAQGLELRMIDAKQNEVKIESGKANVKLSQKGVPYKVQLVEAGSKTIWDFNHLVQDQKVRVQMVDYNASKAVLFQVFDPNGQLVYSETANSAQELEFVPFRDLTGGNGIYRYQIKHDGKIKTGALLRY